MPKNEVKCHKHDGFSITILEVSPTSSSWLSALSTLAVSLAPSVCCAVLVSCSTCPTLSVSSACPSSWPALRSLSSQDSEGWNRKNYMLIFHISNEVTVTMCKWGWVVKCQKHDGFSITILEVSPTSSSWLSALSPLAVSLAPSVCCAVLVSCSTCPALSVSSACPSSWPALRSLSSQDSEGWNRKNYMLI